MSPSGKNLWLVVAAILAAVLLLRNLTTSFPPASPAPAPGGAAEGAAPARVQSASRIKTAATSHRPPAREFTSPSAAVRFVETGSEPENVNVSGTTVDDFSGWTTVPHGYFADGLTIANGTVTLADGATTSGPRSGVLESPPLPLRQPALAAPADPSAVIPPGTEVSVQISLSEDGQSWSPWKQVQQFQQPDGKRIVAPVQASLASGDWKRTDSQTSETVSGPAIRYRMELWSGGPETPAVTDIRIWKREFHL